MPMESCQAIRTIQAIDEGKRQPDVAVPTHSLVGREVGHDTADRRADAEGLAGAVGPILFAAVAGGMPGCASRDCTRRVFRG